MPFIQASWWVFLLRGLAGIVLGALILMTPNDQLSRIARLLGAYLLAEAILNGVGVARGRPAAREAQGRRAEPWWAMLGEGVVRAIFGAILLATAHRLTAIAFFFLVGPCALLSSVFQFAAAYTLSQQRIGKSLVVLAGLLSVATGVVALAFTASGQPTRFNWVGAYAGFLGLVMLSVGIATHAILRGARAGREIASEPPRPSAFASDAR